MLIYDEPRDFSDEAIASEIITCIDELEYSSQILVASLNHENATCLRGGRSDTPKSDNVAALIECFYKWRDYGAFGLCTTALPGLLPGIVLVLMGRQASQLFGKAPPQNCSAVLQAVVARKKIDLALGRLVPDLPSFDDSAEMLGCADRGAISLYDLAILSHAQIQSVRNDFSRGVDFPTFRSDNGNVSITPLNASKWLLKRRSFVDSHTSKATEEGALLVPQARDGSVFNAGCRQGAGFKIGPKGDEEYKASFEDALDALTKMQKPYWRRPSPKSGVPGIVSGLTWISKTRAELGLDS
jgi:hypothetical protein